MYYSGIIAVGRKPKVSFENQKNIFQKYAECLQDANIKYNDPVFSKMSQELENKMSPIALYLSLKRNRKTFFDLDNQASADTKTSKHETLCYSGRSTPISRSASESEDCSLNGECQNFSFYLDDYDCKKIAPLTAYRRRSGTDVFMKYKTLPKFKWSYLIKEKIWLHSKLPCTWVLKKYRIRDDNFFLKGKCSQCNTEIFISSSKKTDKILEVFCKVHNFDETFKHNPKLKSKLTPYKRKQISKELFHKSPIKVRNELASVLITDRQYKAPPVLPSNSALRKIKSDAKLEHLPHSSPILSLFFMAKSSSGDNINGIRELSIFPDFRLYFWTHSQINYYNDYQKKFQKTTLTIDATGSFFETIKLPNGTSATKRLFLYVGLLTSNDKLKSVPVFQMVTDSHSEQSILHWLRKWSTYVDTPPTEIITDDSSALVSACIQAFALYCTTKNYVTRLFSILEGRYFEKPKAFIRLDTSHFIKTLYNLTCFKANIDSHIKYFYIRCILFLKQCENYHLAKATIQDIIYVCLCQCTDKVGEYRAAKSRLDGLLRDVKFQELDAENENLVKTSSYEFDDATDNDDFEFINWFNSIVDDVRKKNPILENNVNKYYYPPFVTTFRRILTKLPLWSNLATTLFESENKAPSSSGIESYFKTLKHLVFKTKFKRFRIDEFFKFYSEYLEGELKSALCDLGQDIANKITSNQKSRKRKISTKQSKPKRMEKSKTPKLFNHSLSEDSIFSDHPSYVENWKGQGKDNDSKLDTIVKFIKNGNLCPSVYINSKYVKIQNTCAFDSIMYLLATGYKNNENVRNIIGSFDKNEIIPQYIKCLSDISSKNDEINSLRANIITQYIENPTTVSTGNHVIYNYNAACNATYIYEHFLLAYITSTIFTKSCTNASCSSNTIKKNNVFLPLNIDLINIFDISLLEEAIFLIEGNGKCSSCDAAITSNYEISNFISFDLNGTKEVALNKVPHTIKVKNKIYSILGAVEFVAPLNSTGIGHYKGHYKSKDGFFCYDDNHCKIRESTDQDVILHTLSYVLTDDC